MPKPGKIDIGRLHDSIGEKLASQRVELQILDSTLVEFARMQAPGWLDAEIAKHVAVIEAAKAEIAKLVERVDGLPAKVKSYRARRAACEQRIKVLENRRAAETLLRLQAQLKAAAKEDVK